MSEPLITAKTIWRIVMPANSASDSNPGPNCVMTYHWNRKTMLRLISVGFIK